MVVPAGKIDGVLILHEGQGIITEAVMIPETVVPHEDDDRLSARIPENAVDELFRALVGIRQVIEIVLHAVLIGRPVRGCDLSPSAFPVIVIWGVGDIEMPVEK